MAGRESRRQLLAPSFIVMASALACGGTSVGNGEKERGGPAMNPPPAGQSGVGGGPAGAGGYGGSANPPLLVGGTAGAGANPPVTFVCPTTPGPIPGQACTGSGQCPYVACGSLSVQIRCVNDKWEYPVVACNPPPLQCPATVPVDGAVCNGIGHFPNLCSYPTPECPSRSATCTVSTWSVNDCATGEAGAAGQPAVGGQGGEGGVE